MNEPSTHLSQIQETEEGYKIKVTSPIQKWSHAISPTILIATTVVLFISTMLSEVLAQLLFLVLLAQIFLYFFKYIFVSDITINKFHIEQGNKIIQLTDIPYLDIHIKIVSDGVQLRIKHIKFKLNNASDIPILTDILEQTADLVFYDNHQLSNNYKALTFKAKHKTISNFSSFLRIQNESNLLRFYDTTNHFISFEVKKNNAKRIRYTKPKSIQINYAGFKHNEYIKGNIRLDELEKLQVIINNKAGLTNRLRQISLLAVKKSHTNYFTPTNHFYIFQSNLRSTSDELTNMRDGEKIYKFLKELPSLANIQIEKIVK